MSSDFTEKLESCLNGNDNILNLARELGINPIRIKELLRGSVPTQEEIRNLEEYLSPVKLSTPQVFDGQIELLRLLLQECQISESNIDILLDYIVSNKKQKSK